MSALFGPGRQGFLDGTINWGATPVIKCALVRGYTFSSAHQFVSEVTGAGGTLVATSAALTKTSALGVADASDVVFSTVTSLVQLIALVVLDHRLVKGEHDVR